MSFSFSVFKNKEQNCTSFYSKIKYPFSFFYFLKENKKTDRVKIAPLALSFEVIGT